MATAESRDYSSRVVRFALLSLALTGSIFCTSPHVHAKSVGTVGHSKAQVYSGALRFLRIDRDYEVTEKDNDAAYLLFRFVPHGKRHSASGAIEIIETDTQTRIVVSLPSLPNYRETVLRDALMRKLVEDYGAAPREDSNKPKESKEKKDPAVPEPNEGQQ